MRTMYLFVILMNLLFININSEQNEQTRIDKLISKNTINPLIDYENVWHKNKLYNEYFMATNQTIFDGRIFISTPTEYQVNNLSIFLIFYILNL